MYNATSKHRFLVEGYPAMPASTVNLNATLILDAPPGRLWPLLSDTGRVDRAMGIPPFERSSPEPDLSFAVSSHYMGVPVAWREYPYEWVFEQWYQVERMFLPPVPVKRVANRTTLMELPGGRTQVDVNVTVEPRGGLGWLAARLYIGQKLLRDLMRTYRAFGELAAAAEQVAPTPPRKPAVNVARLSLGADRLRLFGIRTALIDRLVAHLRGADDPDVLRMRPFAQADAWGEDRTEVLRLFLYATRSGLLDLEWDVLCPNCRGPSVRTSTLADLALDAHCSSCNIRYDVNFDESVELRFSVSADIRDAVDLAYCIGGPANTRHIVSQIWLPAHGTKEVRLPLAEGVYRVRSRQLPAMALINATAGSRSRAAQIRFSADDLTLTAPDFAPGDVALTLENTTGTSLLVVLEQTAWSAQAVSAALVTAMDEFRQLFSSQVLAPGIGVSIRNLTFLFSDLKGSTMLYDSIGDSQAYARVRDHFEVMQAIIARRRGALVKTIGDAVMAVFPSAEDAIEASLEIQREFTAGEIARGNPALHVKLGLHRGPCIAVNANDLLDYFGSTVNIAARVQNESAGGDIVVTPEVLGDPGVQQVLERESPYIETFQRELRGFTQAFTLSRLWVSAASGTGRRGVEALAESIIDPQARFH
jgi:class 3 adenylate cyclase